LSHSTATSAMADNRIIAAKVQVDTGTSNAQVKDLNKNLTGTQQALKQVGADTQGAGTHFKGLRDQISTLPGPLGNASSGAQGLLGTFRALLANPIGAILTALVGVITLLYKAFTNTYEGGQKVEQVFSAISAAGQAVLDNVDKIIGSFKKLLSLDFRGFIDDSREIGRSIAQAAISMGNLTAEAQRLAREQADNDLDQAKRQARLAELRAQAEDPGTTAKARIAAGKALLAEAEANAQADIDLAKRVSDNKIAQLTLEKDGEKKNYIEIQKIRAEQVNVETQNSNEIRRIRKQVTAAEAEEQQKQKEARQKAIAQEKQDRQELAEFQNKLAKLRADNELAAIKDEAERARRALEIKIAEEKKGAEQLLITGKINGEQYQKLQAAIEIGADLQRKALKEKQREDERKREQSFQTELQHIINQTKLTGLTDASAKEKLALDLEQEKKLQDAVERYRNDQVKFNAIKAELDLQFKLEQDQLREKQEKEAARKKLDKQLSDDGDIPINDFDARREALESDLLLVKEGFDRKILLEDEYNAKVKDLSEKRMQIDRMELEFRKSQMQEAGNVLNKLADLIGKKTLAGKALGIAAATINTFQGASEALKQPSTLPSPLDVIAKVANVATVIATGMKTVQSIAAVNVPGGGSGGGGVVPTSAPIVSAQAPLAPTAQSTKIIDSGENNAVNKSIRAHVVESDIQSSANRARRLEANSHFGGGN
jgi:hypothetical protein